MGLSQERSLQRQLKRIAGELKILRRRRRPVEARGCYSDRELAAKEGELGDDDRRLQVLEIEFDWLHLRQHMHQDRECEDGEEVGVHGN